VEAKADAVLLNLGNFADAVSSGFPPGLIARLDWTTAFNEAATASPNGFQTCLMAHPEDALRAGADAVITFLFIGSGDADFEKREVQRVGSLARECERVGMPLIVESLARGAAVNNPRELKWLMLHTRMAAELGADVISEPYKGVDERLRLAYRLAKMISDHEGPRVVQAWFTGLNPELNDRVPVRLLREEDVATVGPEILGAARAFLAGG